MLFPNASPSSTSTQGDGHEAEIAYTPLAIPRLAGPGSLSVVLTAAVQIESNHAQHYWVVYAGVICGMALTGVIAWMVLRTAAPLARIVGQSGIDAMTRVFGFLLIAIGTQFLLTGVSDFYRIPHI